MADVSDTSYFQRLPADNVLEIINQCSCRDIVAILEAAPHVAVERWLPILQQQIRKELLLDVTAYDVTTVLLIAQYGRRRSIDYLGCWYIIMNGGRLFALGYDRVITTALSTACSFFRINISTCYGKDHRDHLFALDTTGTVHYDWCSRGAAAEDIPELEIIADGIIQLDVYQGNVYLLTNTGAVWVYPNNEYLRNDGTLVVCPDQNVRLVQIASSRNSVWALATNGTIYQITGTTANKTMVPITQHGLQFRDLVFAASDCIYAVDSHNNLYQIADQQPLVTAAQPHIALPKYKKIVAKYRNILVLTAANEILRLTYKLRDKPGVINFDLINHSAGSEGVPEYAFMIRQQINGGATIVDIELPDEGKAFVIFETPQGEECCVLGVRSCYPYVKYYRSG